MKIVKRGAEAVLYLDGKNLVKERVRKSYRLTEIDEKLRKLRTRKEAKLLLESRGVGVETPKIINVSEKDFKITMEYIDGKRLKEFFNETDDKNREIVA